VLEFEDYEIPYELPEGDEVMVCPLAADQCLAHIQLIICSPFDEATLLSSAPIVSWATLRHTLPILL